MSPVPSEKINVEFVIRWITIVIFSNFIFALQFCFLHLIVLLNGFYFLYSHFLYWMFWISPVSTSALDDVIGLSGILLISIMFQSEVKKILFCLVVSMFLVVTFILYSCTKCLGTELIIHIFRIMFQLLFFIKAWLGSRGFIAALAPEFFQKLLWLRILLKLNKKKTPQIKPHYIF